MDFGTLIRRFTFLFNCFGLSQFDTNVSSKYSFATIIYFLVLNMMFLEVIYIRHFYSGVGEIIFSIFIFTFLSSEIFIQFTIVLERKNFKKLHRLYNFTEKYMRTRARCSIEFNQFQKRIYLLAIFVLVPHVLTFILQSGVFQTNIDKVFDIIFVCFYFLSTLVKLHIIMHVELLKYFLKITRHWLRTRTPEYSATGLCQLFKVQSMNRYSEILHLKLIHFKLWEISINVNRIFGFSLEAIILRNFIETTYGAYWVYLFLIKDMTFLTLLRM